MAENESTDFTDWCRFAAVGWEPTGVSPTEVLSCLHTVRVVGSYKDTICDIFPPPIHYVRL